MPELPEIEMVRRAVGPRLVGRTVVSADVRQPKVVAHPYVDDFLDRIVGRTFTSLDRRGKYLIAVLDDGQRMVMHMRMTGCLLVTPADMPEERHTHIVMPLDDGSQLRFSDMRRFGRFWLFRKDEDDDISGVSKLGPEPSDPSLDPDYLKDRLGSCRRAIKDCLLDQSVVAGIGNIYSDEILFDTGIDPSCPANILSDEDWDKLAADIPRAMGFFTENNTVSPEEYLESRGRGYRNTPLIRIYGHAGEPCPVCGTTLVRSVICGRSSVHCPMCQRSRVC